MADDDFEIDLYGDSGQDGNDDDYQVIGDEDVDVKVDETNTTNGETHNVEQHSHNQDQPQAMQQDEMHDSHDSGNFEGGEPNESIDYTSNGYDNGDELHTEQLDGTRDIEDEKPTRLPSDTPTGPAAQQGVKRKEVHDERPTDPGASSAITISELNWWVTEDDIRGWANQKDCESEVKNITFSEHKVNGKSKGQAYLEFTSPQAATAVKHHVESLAASQPGSSKYSAIFSSPATNPFRTLPRNDAQRNTNSNPPPGRGNFNNQSNFRGNRGGRGPTGMNNAGNNRGNFQGGQMGNMQSGFGGSGQMGNFGGNSMGGFQNQNNFGNRGGMMGGGMRGGGMPNRGGRGGFNGMPNNMMGGGMGMPMGNMAMGNMGNMGMMPGQFGAPMGMNGMAGFPGQGHFNPAFFQNNQQQMGAGNDWNPHGAKRPRPE